MKKRDFVISMCISYVHMICYMGRKAAHIKVSINIECLEYAITAYTLIHTAHKVHPLNKTLHSSTCACSSGDRVGELSISVGRRRFASRSGGIPSRFMDDCAVLSIAICRYDQDCALQSIAIHMSQ